MAEMHGSIFAQYQKRVQLTTKSNNSYSLRFILHGNSITAETAISLLVAHNRVHWAETGVSRIRFSDGTTIVHDPPEPIILAHNVTELVWVTNVVTGGLNDWTRVRSRLVINFWS
jgi:hypothetical protein